LKGALSALFPPSRSLALRIWKTSQQQQLNPSERLRKYPFDNRLRDLLVQLRDLFLLRADTNAQPCPRLLDNRRLCHSKVRDCIGLVHSAVQRFCGNTQTLLSRLSALHFRDRTPNQDCTAQQRVLAAQRGGAFRTLLSCLSRSR